jgi:hypothetical protein
MVLICSAEKALERYEGRTLYMDVNPLPRRTSEGRGDSCILFVELLKTLAAEGRFENHSEFVTQFLEYPHS